MNIGRLPTGPLQSIVRTKSRTYTITRPTFDKDQDLGETTEATVEHETDIYCFQPTSAEAQRFEGEHTSGDLRGLVLPDADVQNDDRITHGGVVYQVGSPPEGLPDDESPTVKSVTFVRYDG